MNNKVKAFLKSHHPNTKECDYRTPEYLFNWIQDEWGPIDYDAACFADGSNALATPLRLEDEWPISTVYSNPPYDAESIAKWFDKGRSFADNGGLHIMCIPTSKLCQVFFSSRIEQINEIVFLGGRVNFEGPFQVKGGSSRSGTVIIIQRPRVIPSNICITWSALLSDLKRRYS